MKSGSSFLIMFVLLFLGVNKVYSQLSIRPFVGVNSATLTKNFENSEWLSQVGYQGGANVLLGNRMYFQPGLQFEFIRMNFNPDSPIPGFNTDFQASHFRIPLMVGFRALKGGLFNFRLYTGPDVALSVSNSTHSFLGVQVRREDYQRLHWSWNGGVGVDFLFFFVDVGYKFGVSEYFNQNNFDNTARTNIFFANFGIRLGS
jgi:hypothetical protein